MKRPWTPGPWPYGNNQIESLDQLSANMTLANKAPEMAELLIEATSGKGIIWERWGEKAYDLLKEIGYNPTVEEDPAD